MKNDNNNIGFDKEKLYLTHIENKNIELFDDASVLGIYTYVRMMIEHEKTTVCEIVDKLMNKFTLTQKHVMGVFELFEQLGVLTVIKQED